MKRKYIKNLFPEEFRVNSQVFLSQIKEEKTASSLGAFRIFLSILLLFIGLFTLPPLAITPVSNIPFSSCLLFLGYITLPFGQSQIEHLLKFKLTNSLGIKGMCLFIFLLLFNGFHFEQDLKNFKEKEKQLELISIENKNEAFRKERTKKDSLEFYLGQAKLLINDRKYNAAISSINISRSFANSKNINEINELLGISYFKSKDYNNAISYLKQIDNGNSEAIYILAICYKKLGDVRQTIIHLNRAKKLGNSDASREFEKLNPMIKFVIDYKTYCCDGTFSPSNSKSRGACSHHGGVCNWNKPIYQERRKYEISSF